MSTEAPHRLITTRLEFHDALHAAFAEVARVGSRELWLCDEDFADWPLNDPVVLGALTRWAMPHRRLTLIARHYDEVVRRHARFVDWRRQWSHLIEARAQEEANPTAIPALLLAPGVVSVHLVDRVHHRGRVSHDAGDWLRNREMLDALSQRSVASFAGTILGL
jgi:hypothetical protein